MTDAPPAPNKLWQRLPILALLLAAALGYYFYGDALSFEMLAENRTWILAQRDAYYALTTAVFVLLYVAVVATSLPGATILTLTGGFVFGIVPGTVFNVIGATTGAIAVFLAARAGFGRDIAAGMQARGGTFATLQSALKANQWPVLLSMRLIPVIPFFVANLIPAFVGIRLWPFAVTTVLGILPAAVIFTSLGSGLGEVFARGEVPDLASLLRPEFTLPLAGLGVLAILPVGVKLWRGRKV